MNTTCWENTNLSSSNPSIVRSTRIKHTYYAPTLKIFDFGVTANKMMLFVYCVLIFVSKSTYICLTFRSTQPKTVCPELPIFLFRFSRQIPNNIAACFEPKTNSNNLDSEPWLTASSMLVVGVPQFMSQWLRCFIPTQLFHPHQNLENRPPDVSFLVRQSLRSVPAAPTCFRFHYGVLIYKYIYSY